MVVQRYVQRACPVYLLMRGSRPYYPGLCERVSSADSSPRNVTQCKSGNRHGGNVHCQMDSLSPQRFTENVE